MINQNKIPNIIIPESNSRNEFKIYSKNLILFFKDYFNKKRIYIENEEIISKENNHKDLYKYKYYYELFNTIQIEMYKQINENNFWYNLLSDYSCSYKHVKGKNKGKLCQRSIYIEALHKYGKYLCCRHIKKDYYQPKKNQIKIEDRCISINKYNEKCEITKKYGDYCIHHKHNNNHKYICKIDIKKTNIIEKSNRNYVNIYKNKKDYNNVDILNILEIKKDVEKVDHKIDGISSPISLKPILKDENKLIDNDTLMNKYNKSLELLEKLKKEDIKIIKENDKLNILRNKIFYIIPNIQDEYTLLYIYNFLNNKLN